MAKKQDRLHELLKMSGPRIFDCTQANRLRLPLGGIGSGTISLDHNGLLVDWDIFGHRPNSPEVPPQMFAIRVAGKGREPMAKVLQRRSWHGQPECDVSYVQGMEIQAEYPLARFDFCDPDLPVSVSLEAFSPFIPLNSKDSGVPAVLFIYEVTNPQREAVEVSLVACLPNLVGYDGESDIDVEASPGFGGNVNALWRKGRTVGIDMTSQRTPRAHPTSGSMTLTCLSGANFWVLGMPYPPHALWKPFRQEGEVPVKEMTATEPSPKGKTFAGALISKFRLGPRQTRRVVFLLTWHFPNRQPEPSRRANIGRMYNNWFSNSRQVAEYVVANFRRLEEQTKLFHETLFDSTLPRWLLDLVAAPLAVLRSPSTEWMENGDFGIWEGSGLSHTTKGCCGINCTHVLNYAIAPALLFPDLERRTRELDARYLVDRETGAFLDKFYRGFPAEHSSPQTITIDSTPGFALKVYRDYLWTGDRKVLERMWKPLCRAMDFFVGRDRDGDGLPEMEKRRGWKDYAPNNTFYTTFDPMTMYGAASFVCSWWLAALRASEEMAAVLGDDQRRAQFRRLFEQGTKSFERKLWNGRYYDLCDPQATPEKRVGDYAHGLMTDQVIGQWYSHLLDLGRVHNRQRVARALRQIYKHNFTSGYDLFTGAYGKKQVIYSWPPGYLAKRDQGIKGEWLGHWETDGSYRTWSGAEMASAAHMIQEGLIAQGLEVARAIYDRYDGVRANPWSHYECGWYYSRTLSSWSLLLAAEGFHLDAPMGLLAMRPKIGADDFRGFVSTAEGWGSFSQQRTARSLEARISVKYGWISLKTLILEKQKADEGRPKVSATLGGRRVAASVEAQGRTLSITFSRKLRIRAGENLSVKIRW